MPHLFGFRSADCAGGGVAYAGDPRETRLAAPVINWPNSRQVQGASRLPGQRGHLRAHLRIGVRAGIHDAISLITGILIAHGGSLDSLISKSA